MPAVSGHLARVKLSFKSSLLILRAYRWSVDWREEVHDVTTFDNFDPYATSALDTTTNQHFTSFGGGQYLHGIGDFDISLDAYWDVDDNPFHNATHRLVPGMFGGVQIEYDKTSALTSGTWYFPETILCAVRTDGAVRDVIRMSLQLRATGYDATGVKAPTNVQIPSS